MLEVYRLADEAAKHRMEEWTQLKSTELRKLNQALTHAGMHTVQISRIEQAVERYMTE